MFSLCHDAVNLWFQENPDLAEEIENKLKLELEELYG
jgi:hypothetical protein